MVAVEFRQEAQAVVDLVDVLLDQLLGAELGAPVQRAAAHAPHVAVNTLVEGEQQALVVVACPQAAQAIEAQANLGVIVLAGLVDLPPTALARELIVLHCRLAPFVVARALVHLALELL